MRGYRTARRASIVLGLVAALVLPLFALCPCGQEWLPAAEGAAGANGMAADHSCCASTPGWRAAEDCCPQMDGPSRESAEGAARHAGPEAPALAASVSLSDVPLAAAAFAAAPVPAHSPPATARPAVLRL
jgi:hypothetical protein